MNCLHNSTQFQSAIMLQLAGTHSSRKSIGAWQYSTIIVATAGFNLTFSLQIRKNDSPWNVSQHK